MIEMSDENLARVAFVLSLISLVFAIFNPFKKKRHKKTKSKIKLLQQAQDRTEQYYSMICKNDFVPNLEETFYHVCL